MTDIRAVVFDIGNVRVKWWPEALYDSLIGVERRERLFAEVDLHGMNLRVDRGADMGEAVHDLAAQHPGWANEILLWHGEWSRMFTPVIPENIALLRALRAQGMPVFALSNFGRATFDIACATYPFLTEFDQSYISGHLGVTKPEVEIYEILERKSDVAPRHLFLIDDRAENVAAAVMRGWKGHVFHDPSELRQALKRCGIRSSLT